MLNQDTRLTQAARLTEATALLQRMLRGARATSTASLLMAEARNANG